MGTRSSSIRPDLPVLPGSFRQTLKADLLLSKDDDPSRHKIFLETPTLPKDRTPFLRPAEVNYELRRVRVTTISVNRQ